MCRSWPVRGSASLSRERIFDNLVRGGKVHACGLIPVADRKTRSSEIRRL